jgi:hypothetical protein
MDTDELPEGTPPYVAAILRALEAHRHLNEAHERLSEAEAAQIEELWKDNAELRDDLHAVANRLETLTRAFTIDAAEVAQKIVNDANRATLREVKNDD